jgi:hypothetical protein
LARNYYCSIRAYTIKNYIWVSSENKKLNRRSYSTDVLTNKCKEELTNKCNEELTLVQEKALIGVILGDGHLLKLSEKSNTTL